MSPLCEPTLRDLRFALCVAETGNFRQAARRLNIAPSTLSRALSELEKLIGLRLFHRTTRSVAVTPDGARFLEKIEPLVAELTSALADRPDPAKGIRGLLRLNTPFSAALYLLKEVIPSFRAKHPLIELEIHHEERMVDIVANGCDAGIRLGRTVPGDMIGVSFGGPLRWVAVASPDYIAQYGRPTHPNELLNHECIRIRMPGGERYSWEFVHATEDIALDVPGAMTLDRMALMVEAALNGLGIAFVLQATVEEHFAAGNLVMLFPEWLSEEEGYMLYYPGRRIPPAPLDAFIKHLRAMVRTQVEKGVR